MTVEVTTYYSGPYITNGATTVFPFSFISMDADELGVLLRDADGVDTIADTADYSVTRAADGTGSVSFASAPASGFDLYIFSDVSFAQSVEFEDGSGWKASPVNSVADRSAARDIWLKGRVDRAMVAPLGETGGELPSLDNRVGKYLAWDAEGNPVAASGTGPDSGLRSDLAASGGAALTGFLQSGTGASTRSVQSKARDVISANDFGALGDGSNDTSPLSEAMAAGLGREVELVSGTYRTTSPVSVGLNSTLSGKGNGTGINTTTTNHHIVLMQDDGALIRDMVIEGVAGTTVLNNSAVRIDAANDVTVSNIDASGMSGMGVYVSSAIRTTVAFSHVHDLPSTGFINGTDIGSYGANSYGNFLFNRLSGGSEVECGILLQLDSTKNRVIGNDVTAHESYGIIDYDIVSRATGSIIAMNRVEDINGADFGGDKGAGIYTVATGGQIIGFNHVSNTNIGTTGESLAPGGIGMNNMYEPLTVTSNVIKNANWYGIILTANTATLVDISGNVCTEADKGGVYVKASSFANVSGNIVTQLTTTPLTARGIAVNVAGGGPFQNVSVTNNRVRGGIRGIEVGYTNYSNVGGNNVSESSGAGIRLTNSEGIACTGNVSCPSSTNVALDVSACTYTTISGNIFKGSATTLINFSGTCTGSFFDKSNILVGMGVNNIDNAAPGMVVEVYGTAPPTVLNHQVGDRVINRAPAVGQPKAWVCTVAGVPGTWVSEGNL